MRFKKLDLNLLVALDAMLTEANISRAAEHMHLSQSAMSNALGRLRDYFGDELLVVVGRRMELTPRAESLKEAVRDVLLRVDTTIASQPVFDAARAERSFRLFVSDFTSVTLMPPLLALACREAPGVHFELQPQIDQPHRALERGEIDLLIIPESYCVADHPTELLFREQFCCVAWRHSRWAHEPLDLPAYLAAGHVVVNAGPENQAFEEMHMQRRGVERRVEVQTTSFIAAAHLVVGTHRVATVHRRLVRQAAQYLPLLVMPPPLDLPAMRQEMQWHKYRSQDSGLSWLRGLLKQAVIAMDAADTAP